MEDTKSELQHTKRRFATARQLVIDERAAATVREEELQRQIDSLTTALDTARGDFSNSRRRCSTLEDLVKQLRDELADLQKKEVRSRKRVCQSCTRLPLSRFIIVCLVQYYALKQDQRTKKKPRHATVESQDESLIVIDPED